MDSPFMEKPHVLLDYEVYGGTRQVPRIGLHMERRIDIAIIL